LDAIYLIGLVLLSPWLIYKIVSTGKYPAGLWQKLTGRTVRREQTLQAEAATSLPEETTPLPKRAPALPFSPLGGRGQGEGGPSTTERRTRPRAWFHGVSVGEIHLLRQVVGEFERRHPDWECVVSTTTNTGFQEASKAFASLDVFYWPFDFSWAVRRALEHVRPGLIVLAESELWPNFVFAAKKQDIPIALINARMSPKTCRNYARLRWLARPVLACTDLIGVQTDEYAGFFSRLGVPPDRIVVTGSVKYDGISPQAAGPKTIELSELFRLKADEPLLVAGSTQAPEEAILFDIFRRLRARHPGLRLVIVPRQRERFEEVAGLLARSQIAFLKRSQLHEPAAAPVILVDSIGELGALWPLATIGFVGGSMDGKRGGQNMIEPAAAGVPTAFGPHVWNFRDTANRLISAGGAFQVRDDLELEVVLDRWLSDRAVRERVGAAAKRFVESQRGACGRTLDALDRLVSRRSL
jgi:3-deoxy-D-manno-octulosonic-acid transferase